MKIELEKKELINLIGKTQNIVEKKTTMPVLVNILLEAEGTSLKVFATDLEVSLTDEISANIKTPGKVVVSAKNLFEITRKLDEGKLQLTKKENNWLEIKQGKYVSKIVGVNSDDYPIFPAVNPHSFVKIKAAIFKEMIDKTIYSVSNDETRYHLNGVYFEMNPKTGLKMVATDGHRLSLISRQLENLKNELGQGVIIPRKGLNEIKKLLESIDDTIEIAIEGSQFILKHGGTVLMIRLIEGKYPNYQQFIPTKISQKVILKRQDLLNSLERVSLLANQKSKAVLLSLSKGKMEISSHNPELGDAKEEVEINYEGSEMKMGFNAKYLMEILFSINNEKVQIEINDQLSPAVVRPEADQDYTCIIMPMRI